MNPIFPPKENQNKRLSDSMSASVHRQKSWNIQNSILAIEEKTFRRSEKGHRQF